MMRRAVLNDFDRLKVFLAKIKVRNLMPLRHCSLVDDFHHASDVLQP
jgi:hypothetical protein